MTAILNNYRPTVGLSDGEIVCRFCGGDGVDYRVPRRAVQVANLELRARRRAPGEPYCWKIGTRARHRPLALVEAQWAAHGHDLFADHPLLEFCDVCQGMGVLVPRGTL